MARVQYGSLITDISGSMHGHTFQRNAYGKTIRTKPSVIGSPSTSQAARRNALFVVQAAWTNLSESDRANWNNFGSYHYQGSRHNTGSALSGYNLFLKYNLLRWQIANSVYLTIQYWNDQPGWWASVVKLSGGVLTYNPTPSVPTTGLTMGLFLSQKTRYPDRFDPHSVRYISSRAWTVSDQNITAQYLALFGSLPAVGDKIQIKEVILNMYSPVLWQPAGHSIEITS
jgi:hypothetical protein